MKRNALFLLLLLSFFLPGWADNLAQCPVGQPNCPVRPNSAMPLPSIIAIPDNAVAVPQAPVAMTTMAPRKTYVLPSLQEFYVPLQTVYTPIGALFGTKKRAEQELIDYWQTRRTQLDSENQACTALNDDASIKECLQNVRQVEMNKTAAMRSMNEQHVAQQFARSMYYQQAAQQMSNQYNYNRPVNVNCNTYGGMTNCTGY